MPERETLERARRDKRAGKSPSTQAGEFVREEIHHVREGTHGARSAKQVIAIGLSKARRAGVDLPPPPASASARTRKSAASATRAGRKRAAHRPSSTRARAASKALKQEPRAAASHTALSRHARRAASRRPASSRHQSAMKAVRTKGQARRRAAAQEATRTRKRHTT